MSWWRELLKNRNCNRKKARKKPIGGQDTGSGESKKEGTTKCQHDSKVQDSRDDIIIGALLKAELHLD